MNIRELNEQMETFLASVNEDALSDLKDDIANSKTARNIQRGIDNAKQNIKQGINTLKDKLNVGNAVKDIKHAMNKPNLDTEEGIQAEQDYLFDRNVPMEGNADTVGGEIVRCLNKIEYRFYNDGECFGCNDGIETCAAAAAYIKENVQDEQIKSVLDDMCDYSDDKHPEHYENLLKQLKSLVVKYVAENKDLAKKPIGRTMEDFQDGVMHNTIVDYNYFYAKDSVTGEDALKHGWPGDERDLDEVAEECKDSIEQDWGNITDYDYEENPLRNPQRGDEAGWITAVVEVDDEDEEDEQEVTINGIIVVSNVRLRAL